MVGVRTFLESSTIHGLGYISTTRKYARIFWILVVLAGFTGAVFLIHESFYSWSESPVKTTVETFPISDVKFPKVTVCPPKNSYTDLNYDLKITDNITLTEDMRDQLFEYALEISEEYIFSGNNWTKLQEKDRFYNWYYGCTKIIPPWFEDDDYNVGLSFEIHTSAISGVVTTQYYGEQFQPDLIERKHRYWVKVYPPKIVKNNENVTLHFKIEKASITGLPDDSKDSFSVSGVDLQVDQSSAFKNFTPPGRYQTIDFYRRGLKSKKVEEMKMNMMPGFKFEWWYSGYGVDVTPDTKFKYYERTYEFVRQVIKNENILFNP